MLRFRFVVALAIAVSTSVHAGEAHGVLKLDGTSVKIKAASALALTDYSGDPFTLVLLSEAPVDLSAALASPDPYTSLINFEPLDAVTHAMVFVRAKGVSINAHKAGDKTQYLASQKMGLEAKVAGGDAKPLEGSLRWKTSEQSSHIDVTFKTGVLKPIASYQGQ